MYVPERPNHGWNSKCTLGLQLCKCRQNDPMPNVTSSNNSQTTRFKYTTPSSRVELEHVRKNREMLKRMTRHNRPSLSEQWSHRQHSSSHLSNVSSSSSGRFEHISANERELTPLEKKRALRPITKDHHHQDSLFGNSFQSKSFFVVHPEWISETVDNTDPQPLHRPPWPWEQPRYRQNIQVPITYKVDESEQEKKTENQENANDNSDMPMVMDAPMCLPIGYTFTHPGIDLTKPYAKQTQFGAPLVDTSVYKLSY